MALSALECYQTVFRQFPTAACLVDASNCAFLSTNIAFESDLGYLPGEFKIGSLFEILDDERSKQLCKLFVDKSTDVTVVELSMIGKITINNRFTFKGKFVPIDSFVALLTGDITLCSIARVESVDIGLLEKSTTNSFGFFEDATSDSVLSADTFPFSRKGLIDLFQNAAIGVHCTGADGTCLWANRHLLSLLGYEAHEYIGKKTSQFAIQDDDPSYLNAIIARIRKGETVNNIRAKMRAKNGEVKYLIVDSGACLNPDGSFSHTKTFIRDDIESLKDEIVQQEMLTRLKEVAAEKDRFIRIIFHELRTPLNVLSLSVSELAKSTSLAESGSGGLIADLKQQMNYCMGLIDDLSLVMMFDSDNVVHPQPTEHDIRMDLEEVFRLLDLKCDGGCWTLEKEPSFKLMTNFSSKLPREVMYDSHVRRVLFNLLTNAVRFTIPGGAINVNVSYLQDTSSAKKGVLTFRCSNTVSEPLDLIHINKSFQKYLRLLPSPAGSEKIVSSDNRSRNFVSTLVSSNGLGLGLYIAYNILQSLDGMLECSTTDTEACFSFTLPVDVNCDVPKPVSPVPVSTYIKLEELWADVTSSEVGSRHVKGLRQKVQQAKGWGTSNAERTVLSPNYHFDVSKASPKSVNKLGRILVVDDSPICRKVLIRALEVNNFTTDFACDGQEACDKMSTLPCVYCAVLMDLRMPIMDGITATKLIKDMPHASRVPIIVVSAEMGEAVRVAVTEARADHFLSKPVLVDDLLSVLELYVSK